LVASPLIGATSGGQQVSIRGVPSVALINGGRSPRKAWCWFGDVQVRATVSMSHGDAITESRTDGYSIHGD